MGSAELKVLLSEAMNPDSGVIVVMGEKTDAVRNDIPAAFEMLALLDHFKSRLCFFEPVINEVHTLTKLAPGISFDNVNGRVRALLPINPGELADIAFWISDRLPSDQVKSFGGTLAVLFDVKEFDGKRYLLPEWFSCFYVNNDVDHLIPILVLRSVLENEVIGQDWVITALHRSKIYGLPSEKAIKEAEKPIDSII